MRKVKRALAAVLAVLMAGSLSACGVKVQTRMTRIRRQP